MIKFLLLILFCMLFALIFWAIMLFVCYPLLTIMADIAFKLDDWLENKFK